MSIGTDLNALPCDPCNRTTYERLREHCTFGSKPVEGFVVVEPVGQSWTTRTYRVVSNPIGLDYEYIAFFCDSGNLCFGWRSNTPGFVIVHTD